ncbi:MAG: reverse transcriptase domain-containing protein, partial [Candidatus Pacearchaeota archaeon]
MQLLNDFHPSTSPLLWVSKLKSIGTNYFENTGYHSASSAANSVSLVKLASLLERALDNGNTSKCIRLLNHNGLADLANPDIIFKIASKYPCFNPSLELLPPPPHTPAPATRSDEIVNYIKSIRKGSAIAYDGSSMDDMRRLLRNPSFDLKLASVITAIIDGRFFVGPDFDNPLLVSRGVAIMKGDTDVRPIAIDHPITKIASYSALNLWKNELNTFCGPFQLGNPVSGGAEILIHSVRMLLENDKHNCCLKLDLKNAFNSINKVHILNTIASYPPLHGLYKFAQFLLLSKRSVHYSNDVVCSAECGVAQGNNISAALFNIGQAPILKDAIQLFPSCKLFSYYDDHYIIGHPENVILVASFLVEKLKAIDLIVNESKCEVYRALSFTENELVLFNSRQFKVTDSKSGIGHGIIVLGSPVGNFQFINNFGMEIVSDIEKQLFTLAKLTSMEHGFSNARVQTAFYLGRVCGPSQLNFLMRTVPINCSYAFCNRFDIVMMNFIYETNDCMNHIKTLEAEFQSEFGMKICNSIRNGVCGFRRTIQIREAAYIGSLTLCLHYIYTLSSNLREAAENDRINSFNRFKSLLTKFKDSNNKELHDISIDRCWDESISKVQKRISSIIDLSNRESVYKIPAQSNCVSRKRILFLNSVNSFGSLWLHANPTIKPFQMSDDIFQIAFKNRFGFPVFVNKPGIERLCHCKKHPIDADALHPLCCSNMEVRSAIRNSAHCSLKNTLHNVIVNNIKKNNPNAFVDYKEPFAENYFKNKSNSLNNNTLDKPKRRGDIVIQNV